MGEVLLIGGRLDYEIYCHHLKLAFLDSEYEISGFVCTEVSGYSVIDNIPVLPIDSLIGERYDYLINLCISDEAKQLTYKMLEVLGVPKDKILQARVLTLPGFNFDRYIKIHNNPPSIITNHCCGGFLYNALALEFKSPFINMGITDDSTEKLYGDLKHYLNVEPVYLEDRFETNLQKNYPVLLLEDVELLCNHYKDSAEAIEKWKSRVQRVNYDNLFYEMCVTDEKTYKIFKNIDNPNKIAFSFDEWQDSRIITLPYRKSQIYQQLYISPKDMVNHLFSKLNTEFKCIDLLKMLLGEDDFLRAF